MDIKTIAKELFLSAGLTAKDIAERLSVAESTVGSWREKGKWDKLKQDASSIPSIRMQIVINLYRKLLDLSSEITVEHADQLAKLTSTLRTIEQRTPISSYQQVGQQFLLFVLENKKEDFEGVQKLFTEFIISITAEGTENKKEENAI